MNQPTPRQSFSEIFSRLRQRRQVGLLPFIPAGYPDLGATAALIPALQAAGASAIEIGIPFSDPIADGPTIQHAFADTLARKVRVADIFDTVASVRASVSIPLAAMVSHSIVFRHGVERFVVDAKRAGFDGLIIPDLPPPEAQAVCAVIRAAGLDTILMVSPTTPLARRKQIADLCSGFVYYLAVSGVTGARAALPPDLAANIRQLKTLTRLPVAVGFGVSEASHVAQLAQFADAAIVGSAVVRKITEHAGDGPDAIAAVVREFCESLLSSPAPV